MLSLFVFKGLLALLTCSSPSSSFFLVRADSVTNEAVSVVSDIKFLVLKQFLKAVKLISTLASLLIVTRIVPLVGTLISSSHLIVVITVAATEFEFRALVATISVLA